MKLFKIIALMLLSINVAVACQCPLTSLSEKDISKYDIIFKGTIKSISLNKEKSEAIFNISELYRGVIADNFKVLFNDLDECKLDLRQGDEWIIYTSYHQIDNAKLDFCSRSRKYIKNINEDFFAVTTGVSYDEELLFLQTKLGLHKPLKNNPNKVENRNILPSTNQLIITLIVSLSAIVVFYRVFNRFFK